MYRLSTIQFRWLTRARCFQGVTRIVLAEQERTTTLARLIEEAVEAAGEEMPAIEIAIGPEGGWAPAEEALFDANGWRAATLGPRMRAETAAIAALAVVLRAETAASIAALRGCCFALSNGHLWNRPEASR
jgi:RsmE family RNA methyltransferase